MPVDGEPLGPALGGAGARAGILSLGALGLGAGFSLGALGAFGTLTGLGGFGGFGGRAAARAACLAAWLISNAPR